jgi:hypothetical protein
MRNIRLDVAVTQTATHSHLCVFFVPDSRTCVRYLPLDSYSLQHCVSPDPQIMLFSALDSSRLFNCSSRYCNILWRSSFSDIGNHRISAPFSILVVSTGLGCPLLRGIHIIGRDLYPMSPLPSPQSFAQGTVLVFTLRQLSGFFLRPELMVQTTLHYTTTLLGCNTTKCRKRITGSGTSK